MRIVHTVSRALMPVLAAGFCLAAAATEVSARQSFEQWVQSFWPTAKAAGISRETYDRAFAGMTPDPKVIEAANFQPEYVKPVGEYVDRVVSDKRVTTGKLKLEENKALLDQIEKKYGVDRAVVIAIWGVESNFGTQPGDMNVIRALATLLYHGNRASFAKPQLITALKILQRGDISVEAMNGSWAGAMGHTQFIPTTYQAYAVDWDGDGKRNIWNDVPDALASTASYLKKSGWKTGETWGYEVKLPKGMNPKKGSEKNLRSLGEWQKAGVVRINGEPYPRPSDKAGLFAPEGANGPAFLVLNNFRTILRYNNATSYALGVGHLGDRLKGYGGFVKPWPTDEKRLSLEQRTELQQLLAAKGLLEGTPDGVIGPATLEAVKTYQRSKSLPVDGFPSQTILEMLRKEG